ncbi:MAG: diguanylate cyclase domain-containing protein [Chromatocurvus sp.]
MKTADAQQTILIVDDEPANVQALGNLLKGDYRIRVATSGEKALAIAHDQDETQPDLVLLDILMPDMDGYEVCRHLKGNESTNAIAVIFVTALDATSDEELGLRLGAVDYITKPFSPAIVRARVNTHLQLKHKTDLLEQYARLDGLTGIPNRRLFDEQLDLEIRQSLREGHPLSVVMIDIDHFKPFNDNYGHGAGDQCLRQVSTTLSAAAKRPADRVCRYGGEEFVALLPNTDADGARQLAETMRNRTEHLGIKHAHSSVGPVVTISLGTATFNPEEGADQTFLLKRADQALYEAKHAGRNRVATSSLPYLRVG